MGAKAKINNSLCKGEYCTFIKAFDTIASFISSSASFPILSLVSRLKFISKKQKQLDKKITSLSLILWQPKSVMDYVKEVIF